MVTMKHFGVFCFLFFVVFLVSRLKKEKSKIEIEAAIDEIWNSPFQVTLSSSMMTVVFHQTDPTLAVYRLFQYGLFLRFSFKIS